MSLIGSLGHSAPDAILFLLLLLLLPPPPMVAAGSALIVVAAAAAAVVTTAAEDEDDGSRLTDACMCCIMPSLDRESSSIFVSNELTLPALLPAPLLFRPPVMRPWSIIIPGGRSQLWQLFLSSISCCCCCCCCSLFSDDEDDLPCLPPPPPPVVVPELCESLSSPSSPCLLMVCRLCFIRLF